MHSRIYHLHALTGLHAGTGQGGGVIDLPIAREKSTGLPVVPGSSVKGVLRGELEGLPEHRVLFGPDTENASEHAGALAFGDARLLCFPVRSLSGTFAWTTCPMVLHRYRRDWAAVGSAYSVPEVPNPAEAYIQVCTESVLVDQDNAVFLEDLDLSAMVGDADAWGRLIADQLFADDAAWQALFRERFAIVSDAVFDFLAETATEIVTRIRMQEGTRTVAKGGLWFEEHLPAESLLWGVAAADRSRFGEAKSGRELLALLPGEARLQIGGKASVGRGQARWLLSQEAAA